jgi:DNA-binding response OmpR family regulator
MKLLVVDDDVGLARAVARLLGQAGHAATVVHGFRDALRMEGRFDCGVLDIDLADGNGVDLAVELLRTRRVANVVFFSGSTGSDTRAGAARIGPLIEKCGPLDELLSAVTRVCAEQARAVGDDDGEPRSSDDDVDSEIRPKAGG